MPQPLYAVIKWGFLCAQIEARLKTESLIKAKICNPYCGLMVSYGDLSHCWHREWLLAWWDTSYYHEPVKTVALEVVNSRYCDLSCIEIPIIKIWCLSTHLIFIMGISVLVASLYWDGPLKKYWAFPHSTIHTALYGAMHGMSVVN